MSLISDANARVLKGALVDKISNNKQAVDSLFEFIDVQLSGWDYLKTFIISLSVPTEIWFLRFLPDNLQLQ
ncbi:hypothetical protein CAL7716_018660 [Calothrix sp. PCC 7716]|nr:hypothetical protein CAL7716_018660 [Calothrix sp. PCC 7716]